MAAVVADTVAVNLTANTQQYDRKIAAASRTFTGLMNVFVGAQTFNAFKILSDAATMLDNSLKVAGLEGESLIKVQRQLYESATRNAAPIEAMAQLFQRAALSSKQLGVSTQEIVGFIDRVGLALRVSGRSSEEARGALIQLSQAIGAGIVRAEEFNSIAEGAPVILQAVAAGLKEAGGDFAKLRKLVIDGQISSKTFFRAFEAGAYLIEERSEGMSLTIDQSFTQLRNSMVSALSEFNKTTGASNSLAETIQMLAKTIDESGQSFKRGEGFLADFAKSAQTTWGEMKKIADEWRALQNLPPLDTGRVGMFATIGSAEKAMADAWKTQVIPAQVSVNDDPVKGKGKGKGRESPYNREIRQLQESIRERELEITLIGKSQIERDRANAILEIENAARREGVTLTATQRLNILALADSYAQAAQRAREAEEIQRGWIALQEEFGNAAINAIDGLITGTKDLNQVLSETLRNLAKMALQAAILGQGPLAGILGTANIGGASDVGGFVGALFGGFRAAGGPVNSGRSYIVGENGPEMFVPGRNGMIVPNDALSAGKPQAGGSIILNNDFRDSSAPAIAALNAKIDRLERSLPMIIQQTQQRQRLNQPFYGG